MEYVAFNIFAFGFQLFNLLILVLGIYLIGRLLFKAGSWFHWCRQYEEEILRKLDELIKLEQTSPKDKD